MRISALIGLAISASLIVGNAAGGNHGWRTLSLKTASEIVELLRHDGAIYLDFGPRRNSRPARFFRVSLAAREIVLTAVPDFQLPLEKKRPGMLPDGVVSENGGVRGAIAEAWLSGPTRRYGHAVIGDGIEASGIRIRDPSGLQLELRLPTDSVFEDRLARLVDLDGDGIDEIVAVRSYLDRGAAIAVIKLRDNRLVVAAETEPIGLSHRWLNPAGFADFDGDGRIEIASVVTPHIGGVLEMHQLSPAGLALEGRDYGYSNHAHGSRELGLSALIDANGDGIEDLALPSASRKSLKIVTFAGGRFRNLAEVSHDAPITTAIHAADIGGDTGSELIYGLDGGTLVVLTR